MLHSAREQQCQQPIVLMRRSQSISSSSCPPNEQISEQIQQEIHRFESVHPCIYDFYDLIDTIDDEALQEQLREQVVYLEDALINSQEWTLGRIIPELKLGVVGSLDSGKTSLVHFFLTGSGRQESPEGGRFKKEMLIDNRSYLLLIRDEGSGQPEFQFTNWIDGVIIVFAVESRESYQTALQFFKRMTSYRNLSDIPVFLVGTKDTSNENARRVIGEEEARKASQTMKMCGYFECCSAFGHNSEPIFQSACQRIVQQRKGLSPNNTTSVPLGRVFSSSCNTNPGTPAVHQQHNNYSQQQHSYNDLNQQLYKPPTYTHHQRSVSAVPTQDQLPSSRSSNGGQEAVRRRITNPCTSSATSTFYQRPLSPTEQHNKHHYTHRDNNPYNFDRGADTRSCSTFLMNSTPMPNSNRVSNPEFAGISPAYSHNNLASQYSFANGSIPLSTPGPRPVWLGVDQASGSSNTLVNSSYVASTSQLPPQHTTPSSTPNTQRKNRRISNIFRPNKGSDHQHHNNHQQTPEERMVERIAKTSAEINMGVGRAIPIKQGLLYKRSSKALNKDWKKKYVCLYSDGRLSYHQNLKEYMDKDSRGKEVYLGLATVRVAGRQRMSDLRAGIVQLWEEGKKQSEIARDMNVPKQTVSDGVVAVAGRPLLALACSVSQNRLMASETPRATNRNSLLPTQATTSKEGGNMQSESISSMLDGMKSPLEGDVHAFGEAGGGTSGNSDGDLGGILVTSTSSSVGPPGHSTAAPSNQPVKNHNNNNSKKKRGHRRLGSGTKNNEEEEDCEFEIISCNQKQWEFSASSAEERDEWVSLIEEQIEKCIQLQPSQKEQQNNRAHGNKAEVQALRNINGNDKCADCSTPKPDWASLNLGTLICIECSGIHRNLGSHISRVRSIDLDDWPVEYLLVMQAIGNDLANSIWEHNAPNGKPTPESSREQKENWIKIKYEQKLFLPPVPVDKTISRQVIDAVLSRDLPSLMLILPRCEEKDVNGIIGNGDKRTPLHLACSIGAAEVLQLLIWYNADIRLLDEMGRSALWHARHNGSKECVAILLNAGLPTDYGLGQQQQYPSMMTNSNYTNSTFQPPTNSSDNIAKFRRQSDLVMRNPLQPSQNQNPMGQPGITKDNNGFGHISNRSSDSSAFHCMPAGMIK